MLHLHFGITEYPRNIIVNNDAFSDTFKREWLASKMSKDMIEDVDKTTVLRGTDLESSILGAISPMELSSGVKGLMLMEHLNIGNVHYLSSQFGDNCYNWIFKLCENKEIHMIINSTPRFNRFNTGECKVKIHGDIELDGKVFVGDEEIKAAWSESLDEVW